MKPKPTEGWNEAELHAWLAGRLARVTLGSMQRLPIHDAAVIGFDSAQGHLAVCCDRTEAGIHFTGQASMLEVAHKAVGRSLSDLAATAANPIGIMLALAAPRDLPGDALRSLLSAVIERGAELGAPLLGGDLTGLDSGLSLVVTALGQAPKDPPGRDRLQVGDGLFLTGPVGGSRLGRHLRIKPRLALGRALYAAGARAMMDISDGLAIDLSRLARASVVVVEMTAVAVHESAQILGGDALQHALFDGEDHELLVGLPIDVAKGFVNDLWQVGRVRAAEAGEAAGLHLERSLQQALRGVEPPVGRNFLAFDPMDSRVYLHGR